MLKKYIINKSSKKVKKKLKLKKSIKNRGRAKKLEGGGGI
jgi:hypothetical protein